MNKIFCSVLMTATMMGCALEADACTNFIVGKKASADGSVICSYSANDYGMRRGKSARFLTGTPTSIMGKSRRLLRLTMSSAISMSIR